MRKTTSIVMFYIWLTAAANLVESTGISEAMGVPTSSSASSAIDDAVETMGKISGGGGSSESLIGVFTLVADSIEVFLISLTAAPRIMAGMGVPLEIVIFLHAPVGLLAARLGIYALSGRDI